MSRLRADNLTNRAATGAPLFTHGASVTGVVTATSFDGNVTGTTGTFSSATIHDHVINTTGINVSGIVTATSFSGDGNDLTGVGAGKVTLLTSGATLSSGNAYMINASSTITLTLPASPATGDAVDILNNTQLTHNVSRNGSTIQGLSEDMTINITGVSFKIWYTGSTWSLF